ncbi:energy transducer TonB, partial [Acinetobacter nosocomialis]
MPLVKAWWKDPIFNSAVFAAVILHVIFLTLEFGMPQ